MNISSYEVVYKSTIISESEDITNPKGLICAHSQSEALVLAEDLIRSIKEKMNEKEEEE